MAKKKKTAADRNLTINIIAVVIIALEVFGFRRLGPFGAFIDNGLKFLFGTYNVVIYILILIGAIHMFLIGSGPKMTLRFLIPFILLFCAFLLWESLPFGLEYDGFDVLSQFIDHAKGIMQGNFPAYGGFFGSILYSACSALVSHGGVYVIISALIVIALIVIIDVRRIIGWLGSIWDFLTEEKGTKKKKQKKSNPLFVEETTPARGVNFIKADLDAEEEQPADEEQPKKTRRKFIKADTPVEEVKEEETAAPHNEVDAEEIKKNASEQGIKYQKPSVNLLDKPVNSKASVANTRSAEEKGERLVEILEDFGIGSQLVGYTIGPSVTKFEIKPDSNVKISRILGISDNLKMELAAKNIRIEAPVPGKSVVGVEIPNAEMTMVKMSEVITQLPKEMEKKPLVFGLGKDLTGKPVFCQLDKMPHLLVAGATGSGKSVCINSIITTLVLRCDPNDVRLLLVDPKKVEFTQYKNLPHLVGPVINDSKQAAIALGVMCQIMDDRYDIFAAANCRNIEAYNNYVETVLKDPSKKLPRIVVIIDELADLMSTNKSEVEQSIQRITQLARAAGIHLIVATQRPSVDVITGLIKSNIPSRIAFAVSSAVDSRTILDMVGAEKLLGNGDMLYCPAGENGAIRVQGCYVSDSEIEKIAQAASNVHMPYMDEFVTLNEPADGIEGGFDNMSFNDNIYDDVVEFVKEQQKASTSLVQRKFGIGYNRAARIIDVMEQRGLIGPAQGSKPRDVYIKPDEPEEMSE